MRGIPPIPPEALPPLLYPKVLSEDETIEAALSGESLARIGDGELRLALGQGKHIAQEQLVRLSEELREIMKHGVSFVSIPNSQAKNGKPVLWGPTRYSGKEYVALYDMKRLYGSSFICRPDSAPHIDREDYWLKVRRLWEGKDVTLVIGSRGGSIISLPHARRVRVILGPERDAYAAVDRLEEAIGTPDGPVLICLGPCATVLAERLARKGHQGLDMGHMGRFMPQRYQRIDEWEAVE